MNLLPIILVVQLIVFVAIVAVVHYLTRWLNRIGDELDHLHYQVEELQNDDR